MTTYYFAILFSRNSRRRRHVCEIGRLLQVTHIEFLIHQNPPCQRLHFLWASNWGWNVNWCSCSLPTQHLHFLLRSQISFWQSFPISELNNNFVRNHCQQSTSAEFWCTILNSWIFGYHEEHIICLPQGLNGYHGLWIFLSKPEIPILPVFTFCSCPYISDTKWCPKMKHLLKSEKGWMPCKDWLQRRDQLICLHWWEPELIQEVTEKKLMFLFLDPFSPLFTIYVQFTRKAKELLEVTFQSKTTAKGL